MQTSLLLITLIILGFISLLFNYLILTWSKTLGSKNQSNSDQIRWSETYKPAIGGVSFYIVFLIAYLTYSFAFRPDLTSLIETQHLGILLAVSVGFFAGLADDAFNTVPMLKLSAQIITSLILIFCGVTIELSGNEFLDAALTIFWVVAVMNSINMLDNMDGITAVSSLFILAEIAILALPISENNLFFTFICGGTAAAVLGFLYFNWHPSKMFMGDTGSQMLGAILASVGIIFFWNNHNIAETNAWWQKIAIVACAFVIPIGDSITVTINRLRRGKSPMVGGRDHTTHHLSFAGLKDNQVGMVMIAFSCISLVLFLLLSFVDSISKTAIFTIMLIYSILVISFLYSTTHWKKAKSIFEEKHLKK